MALTVFSPQSGIMVAVSDRIAISRSYRTNYRHDFAFDSGLEYRVLLKEGAEHLVHHAVL